MIGCTECEQHAAECALDNWLDDKGRRRPHPTLQACYIIDQDLSEAEWAEVAEWAALLTEMGMALCPAHSTN